MWVVYFVLYSLLNRDKAPGIFRPKVQKWNQPSFSAVFKFPWHRNSICHKRDCSCEKKPETFIKCSSGKRSVNTKLASRGFSSFRSSVRRFCPKRTLMSKFLNALAPSLIGWRNPPPPHHHHHHCCDYQEAEPAWQEEPSAKPEGRKTARLHGGFRVLTCSSSIRCFFQDCDKVKESGNEWRSVLSRLNSTVRDNSFLQKVMYKFRNFNHRKEVTSFYWSDSGKGG